MQTHCFRTESELPEWLSTRMLAGFVARNIPGVDIAPPTMLRVLNQVLSPPGARTGMVLTAEAENGLVGVMVLSKGMDGGSPSSCIAVEPEFRERGVEDQLLRVAEDKTGTKPSLLASPSEGLNVREVGQ